MKVGRKSAWDTKIAPRLEEIKGWCRDGCTDEQIAERLRIHIATFYRAKAANSELRDALKETKESVDLAVENSLLKRAMGFEYEEETIEGIVGPNGETIKKTRKIVKKIMAPDTTAAIFWLKNRRPEKWRDKRNVELTGKNDQPVEYIFKVVEAENESKND